MTCKSVYSTGVTGFFDEHAEVENICYLGNQCMWTECIASDKDDKRLYQ